MAEPAGIQRLVYLVTVEVDNTKGRTYNADRLASNIIGWGCSPDCEGAYDIESAQVIGQGVTVEWRRTGGKVKAG